MNKIILIIVGLLLAAGVGYYLLSGSYQSPSIGVPAPGEDDVPEMIVDLNGDDDDEPLSEQELNITSREFSFRPNSITVDVDEPVVITFQNTGIHTFTVDELGINRSLSGSSVTVEFTPTKSGTFEFYCSIPGHREQGMVGSLVVR